MMPKLIEFDPPPNLTLPEGLRPGEEFEFMARFRLKPSGKICLVAIDEEPLPGYSDKEPKSMMDRYREEMG